MFNGDFDSPDIRDRWDELAEKIGPDAATYCICAAADVPYNPKIQAKNWAAYIQKLKNKATVGFLKGETDPQSVFQRGMGEMERWKAEWGVGDPEHPYEPTDYRRLDEILRTLSARNAGGMDAQQEFTLRYCAQLALLREKSFVKGDPDSVKKTKDLDKMINDNLAAENLRKKYEGPETTARIDGIVDAVLKHRKKTDPSATKEQIVGLTCEQATEICAKWLISHGYSVTMDAANHALLTMLNASRVNSDLPTMPVLPKEFDFSAYEHEFQKATPAVRAREKSVYDYLGLARGRLTQTRMNEQENEMPDEKG